MSANGIEARLSDVERVRLTRLAEMLRVLKDDLVYVDYAGAERASERLAALLAAEFGLEELRGLAYRPIPRGGLIVLGMLAYALDLPAGCFEPAADPERPLVIVDDCALSGARLRRELTGTGDRLVVFAHLYSHPELRTAILDAEPSVDCCIAAHDLEDRLDRYLPEPAMRTAWRDQWHDRAGAGRYWMGCPDLVSFAWSEPDRPFWNPLRDGLEDGWRFVPPHLCLKNRTRLGVPPAVSSEPRWQVPVDTVVGQFDDQLWLWNGREGGVFALDGVAADMWRALAALGDETPALEFLLARYEVSDSELLHDLEEFAALLVERGLLEPGAAWHGAL